MSAFGHEADVLVARTVVCVRVKRTYMTRTIALQHQYLQKMMGESAIKDARGCRAVHK
jgi:hypothetical protein